MFFNTTIYLTIRVQSVVAGKEYNMKIVFSTLLWRDKKFENHQSVSSIKFRNEKRRGGKETVIRWRNRWDLVFGNLIFDIYRRRTVGRRDNVGVAVWKLYTDGPPPRLSIYVIVAGNRCETDNADDYCGFTA